MWTKIVQCQEFSTILVNIIVYFNNLTHFRDNFGGRASTSVVFYLVFIYIWIDNTVLPSSKSSIQLNLEAILCDSVQMSPEQIAGRSCQVLTPEKIRSPLMPVEIV